MRFGTTRKQSWARCVLRVLAPLIEPPIVAQIAWHATELYPRPHWAIVFGGLRYFIIHIVYVADEDKLIRPALYCSDIYDIRHPSFPLPSVVVYMTLSSQLTQKEFLDSFKIPVPVPSQIVLGDRLAKQTVVASSVSRVSLAVLLFLYESDHLWVCKRKRSTLKSMAVVTNIACSSASIIHLEL